VPIGVVYALIREELASSRKTIKNATPLATGLRGMAVLVVLQFGAGDRSALTGK